MFLKNKNIIFKTRRSKVTDYAALNKSDQSLSIFQCQAILDLFPKIPNSTNKACKGILNYTTMSHYQNLQLEADFRARKIHT